ncbi:MAG: sugar ABC transporter substrate-binding protein [Chloroflexi bacterium]|nr:sugar ABC transporter substrate-binding protein [Chloroflexota bacterium]
MERRRWALPTITLSIVLIAAACGSGGGTAAPPGGSGASAGTGASPAGEKVTFRLTTWAGEDEAKELQELVLDKINAEATDFEIVHEPAPADYYTKLQTTIAGGTGADFMWLSQEYVAGYASRGALLDLTAHLAAVDNPAAKLDGYFPDVIKPAKYQDKVYGLPWIAQPVILYYNPKLFDAAGIDPPDDTWDWAKFRETAVELTKDDQYGFTANGWPPIQQFIWQAGGEVITDDLSSSPIDSPEAMEAVEFYKSLVWNEECCPTEETITEQGFGEMFKAGKVAMFMGGAADTFDGLDVVGATVVPKGPENRANLSYVAVTAVNSATKNPELAAKALAALTDGIHHWKIVAPRPELATAEVILASIPEKWKAQKEGQVDAIVAATEEMRAFNVIPRHQEWDGLFWSEFQDPVFHDKSAPAEAAPTAREKLEALLP